MLRNYLKVAFRNLIRHKVYSYMNIVGLGIGMGMAVLIGLWMYDELSYDGYHLNRDRIAMVMQNQTFDGEVRTWDSYQLKQNVSMQPVEEFIEEIITSTAVVTI